MSRSQYAALLMEVRCIVDGADGRDLSAGELAHIQRIEAALDGMEATAFTPSVPRDPDSVWVNSM